MAGDDRVRACAKCQRQVFDLSAMTAAEAAVVVAADASPCVRFTRKANGTVRHRLAVLAAGATLAVAPAVAAEPAQTAASSGTGSDSSSGSGSDEIIDMSDTDVGDLGPEMGVMERQSYEPAAVTLDPDIVVVDAPARPPLEWSIWGRLGLGVGATPRSLRSARTVIEPEPASGDAATWDAAAAADVSVGVAHGGDLRLGAWAEVRTSTAPVAGGELVLDAAALDLRGSVVVRAGANPHVVTGELGVGWTGSRMAPPHERFRHVIGGRLVVAANRSLDDPRAWSATLGIELEPIGALHAVLDLVTGR
jgi:hypothetical protein